MPEKRVNPAANKNRVLLLGMPNSGTTTLLYKLKIGLVVTTTLTTGFNVENIDFPSTPPHKKRKKPLMAIWDVGSQGDVQLAVRVLWRHYYPTAISVI